jgi:hypothetical protein
VRAPWPNMNVLGAADVAVSLSQHRVLLPRRYITNLGDRLRCVCYGDMAPSYAGVERAGRRDGPQTDGLIPPLHQRLELLVREVLPDLDDLVTMSSAVRWTGSRPLSVRIACSEPDV